MGMETTDVNAGAAAMAAIFLLGILVVFIVFYVYMAICLQVIAKKTNTENGWLAWIPIANLFLMCNIAKKSLWWVLLMLIPIANIVFMALVWMEIAKARGKESWLGILMVVPVANFIIPGYLAFSK